MQKGSILIPVMYTYIHTHTCIEQYACMHVFIHMYINTCIQIHACLLVSIYLSIYICIYVHTHISRYSPALCTSACLYRYTYILAYLHTTYMISVFSRFVYSLNLHISKNIEMWKSLHMSHNIIISAEQKAKRFSSYSLFVYPRQV